ncbi:MAG: hypothetical protein ACLQM6_07765 [Acidobacteriaceae bacterium]
MNTAHGTILGLVIAMGGWACSAQVAAIPSGQTGLSGRLSTELTAPVNQPAGSLFSSGLPSGVVPVEHLSTSAAGFVRVPRVTVSRTLDSRYFLLNGLHLTMALLDVVVTQRCIATGQYREGNPLMPSSLGAQLGVDFALVGYGSFVSYKMKKEGFGEWWITPMIGVATHSVGVSIGFNDLAHR